MTPQELKNSILQLAIQGKLVEHRPEEGTAKELYQQIQEEKRRLIKEGKIKKEKPLPEITEDEVPFEIPESWRWVYIGDIFLHNTGKAQNSSGSTNGVIRKFITTSNLYWNSFDFSKVKEMAFTEQELVRCTVQKGDLLVCEGGDCGRSAIWTYDEQVCIQNHVHRLRPYKPVSIEFFYHLFYLYKFTGKLRGRGVAIQGLSNEAIHKVICPLPPLAEQKRIVAKIEGLLPYIDRYEQAWSRLEEFNKRFPIDMQKSILQMAIQGRLVEHRPEEGTAEELYQQIQAEKRQLIKEGKTKKEKPLPEIAEDEIPFEIPENWKWCPFLSAVDIATNLVSPDTYQNYIHIAPDNIEKGTGKLLDCHTVRDDKVTSANHLFFKGQILYSKIRPLLKKAVVAPFDGLCSADMYPLSTKLESKFVLYFLLSPCFNVQIARAMSSRVKMPKINQKELGKVLIPLPPLAEQKRIVAKLEELLPLCERLHKA